VGRNLVQTLAAYFFQTGIQGLAPRSRCHFFEPCFDPFRRFVRQVNHPVGALADRIGHKHVLVAGYALGVLTAILMALAFVLSSPATIALLVAIFVLAGIYIAVQDGLEASLTASYVPGEIRSISYGILGSVNGVGDFVSSLVVGFLWTAFSPIIGFGFAAVVMAVGTLVMFQVPAESR